MHEQLNFMACEKQGPIDIIIMAVSCKALVNEFLC